MLIYRVLLFVFAVPLLYSCGNESTEATVEEEIVEEAPTDEWVNLLADDELTQWKMYNDGPLEGWQVTNGELHASGAGWDADQDLITQEEYDDFELALEWKIEPGNSSGIFFDVQQDPERPIYESAPEYQVMDDEGWDSPLEPNQRTAGNYAMHAPEGATLKPVGEWNTTRIVVNHPHVEHWLNGKKVVTYELGDEDWQQRKAAGKWAEVDDYGVATSGHIGLQNAGKVVYRDIKIREL